MFGKTQNIVGQILAGIGFIQPEILGIRSDTLAKWRREEPRLKKSTINTLTICCASRRIRSAEVEEVLGLAQDPFASLYTTLNVMTNSEMEYPSACTSDGRELVVTPGTLDEILASPDREARTHWEDTGTRIWRSRIHWEAICRLDQGKYIHGASADTFLARRIVVRQ